MATTKSRINITLPDDVKKMLDVLAKRDKMPTATKAERLLEMALEIEEDAIWEKIASQRDTPKTKWISIDDV